MKFNKFDVIFNDDCGDSYVVLNKNSLDRIVTIVFLKGKNCTPGLIQDIPFRVLNEDFGSAQKVSCSKKSVTKLLTIYGLNTRLPDFGGTH